MTDRSANVAFSIGGADQAKQDIDGVRTSMEQFGDSGKQSAQTVTDALQNIQDAQDRVNQKIEDGKAVTVRDGTAIAEQFQVLKGAIDGAFGGLQNAPVQVQQAFATAEAQFTSTQAKVRTLTAATDENKFAVQGNVAQWSGWTQELAKLDPALGKITIGAAGLTAAWEAGWAAGKKMDTLFGQDMSAWQEDSDRFFKGIGVLLDDAAKGWVALGLLVKDVLTGHFDQAKQDFEDYKDALKDGWHDITVELTGTRQEMDAVFLAHQKETQSTKDALKALDEEQSATADLTAEKKKLVEEINAENDAQKKLAATMAELKAKQMDAQDAIVRGTSDIGYYTRSLTAANSELDAQKNTVQELTDKYGVNNPLVTEAKETQDLMAQSVANLQKRLDDANKSLETANQKLEGTKTALEDAEKATNAQDAAEEGHKKSLDEVSTALDSHTVKTKAAAEAIKEKAAIDGKEAEELQKASDKIDNAIEKTTRHSKAIKDNAQAASDATDSVQQLGEATGIAGNKAGEAAEGTIVFGRKIVELAAHATDAKKSVADLADESDDAADSTEKVATNVQHLGTAAADAAAKMPALGAAITGELDAWRELAALSAKVLQNMQGIVSATPSVVSSFAQLSAAASAAAGPTQAGGGSNSGLPPYQAPGGPIPMTSLH